MVRDATQRAMRGVSVDRCAWPELRGAERGTLCRLQGRKARHRVRLRSGSFGANAVELSSVAIGGCS